MAQKLSSNKESTIGFEALSVLHEVMHSPAGSINFSKLQKKLSTGINNDVKKLTLYCFQQSYVEYDGVSIQMTDAGVDHYLNQQKTAWV
ncbi:hypothetical protein [Vibrio maerlii]|uniref:hypothetical protein n=1 Tax=Vibrio maerlii TaxID=2231648 RepID=UPI000E3D25F8|nr:hypothetical protein [Vibrio maerlii]